MRDAVGVERLVLPSPNGSAISLGLAEAGSTVVGAGLRNASAVARWLREQDGLDELAVVAGGERWPDGSLRPAVEDLWGAGAVIAGLVDLGATDHAGLPPEARTAAQAYRSARFPDDLLSCDSGQELVAMGFADDVAIAAEVDVSTVVPVLRDGAFRAG